MSFREIQQEAGQKGLDIWKYWDNFGLDLSHMVVEAVHLSMKL